MQAIRDYLKQVSDKYSTGEAKEHAYRAALGGLLEAYGGKGVQAINDSLRISCGSPDFIVLRKDVPLGYAEAKDIGIDLDKTERDEQLKRYRESLSNLILTDYLEFRWYSSGELKLSTRIGTPQGGKIKPAPDAMGELDLLLRTFIDAQTPTIGRPNDLARRMARTAQLIRSVIQRAFEAEETDSSPNDPLHDQLQSFRDTLLDNLSKEEFADMYAQTICYGMFAARANSKAEGFSRDSAARMLPKTNPFLRKLFAHIAGPDLDERVAWVVDDLAELLRRSDMASILSEFGARKGGEDPVVHFYETFLAAYDPKMREARGVYYTPEPVISYIVRSVDEILKRDFSLKDGLASKETVDWPPAGVAPGAPAGRPQEIGGTGAAATQRLHKVQILDPATGTGSFLFGVVDQIHRSVCGPDGRNKGKWNSYVPEHLLPRLHGFELLMAPYTVAHLKLSLQLAETGYQFDSDERLSVYLTNTLDEPHLLPNLGAIGQWLSEEAAAANRVKRDLPLMIVMGNPPYSIQSQNLSEYAKTLVERYKFVNGERIRERGALQFEKNIQEDYVKFLSFAESAILATGQGIVAMIVNSGFIDNPSLRGLRDSLFRTFDIIYVVDLNGNSHQKQKDPLGRPDENVFDIRQGVAIFVAAKLPGVSVSEHKVSYVSVGGNRSSSAFVNDRLTAYAGKYGWLMLNDVVTTQWRDCSPQAPRMSYLPSDNLMAREYAAYLGLDSVVQKFSGGVITARDALVVDSERTSLLGRLKRLAEFLLDHTAEDALARFDVSRKEGWDHIKAMAAFGLVKDLSEHVRRFTYRPLDTRYLFYHSSLVWSMSRPMMSQMIKRKNLSLIFMRQAVMGEGYSHFLVSDSLVDNRLMYSNRGIMSIAPLYLSNDASLMDLESWSPNFTPEFITECEQRWGLSFVPDGKGDLGVGSRGSPTPGKESAGRALAATGTIGPEDVFHYMYGVFHSPQYRLRYADFLKRDFPRLPLTSNLDLLRRLCALGERLTALHLMRDGAVDEARFPLPGFPVAAAKGEDRVVEKVRYEAEKGRVWINKSQYFEGVAPEVWDFHIGGYQVCEKWLKDRKSRTLSSDDIDHYCLVVATLAQTRALMGEIDAVIEANGGWPLV